MNQSLTKLTDTALQQVAALTIKDIKDYLCPSATDGEAMMFLRLCQAQGLNPWLREAYLIKYGGQPATMVVGKETFTKRAEANPQFDGFRAGIIVERNSEIIEREGAFLAPEEKLLGGWAEVYRKDRRVPHKITASLAEYTTGQSNWKTKPATMIRKVPLVQALRESFPTAFAGLYDASEMGVAEDALEGEIIHRETVPPVQRATEAPSLTPDELAKKWDEQEARLTLVAETTGKDRGALIAWASTWAGDWEALHVDKRERVLAKLEEGAAKAPAGAA